MPLASRRSFIPAALLVLMGIFPGGAAGQLPVVELDSLVVTTNRIPRTLADVSTHVTILSGDEIRSSGVRQVSEALRTLAGVHVVQGGSPGALTSLFMRGAESDHVLVLMDGVQLNRPGGSIDLSTLTTENVERIEIVRGPHSALYGSDAVAGVIQIISKDGGGPTRASAIFRGGTFGRLDWSADLSGGNDAATYSLTFGRTSTDGILPFNNRHENTALGGTVSLTPDSRTTLRLSARYTDHLYHTPTDGAGNPVDENAFSFGDELVLSAELGRSLSEALEVRALLTTHEIDGGFDDRADGPADTAGFFAFTSLDDIRRSALDLRGDLAIDAQTTLTMGAELELESERTFNESESEFGASAGHTSNDRWNRGYYTQLVADRGALAADAGLRVEDNGRFGTVVTFRLGGALAPWRGGKLHGSVGRAVKEPTFFENFATGFAVGNPDLDPERSLAWEVGGQQTVAEGRVRVGATYFSQSFKDLIQFRGAPPPGVTTNFVNVAEADARGIELDLGVRAGRLRGEADYTYLDTEVIDSGVDEGSGATFVEGERLVRRPTHAVRLALSHPVAGRGSLSAQFHWVGRRDDRDFATFPATPVVLGGYARVDLGGDVTIVQPSEGRPGFGLLLRVENLLDERYEEALGFAAPGRAIYLGGKVSFGAGGP